jgi:hypothetical protein
MATVPRNKTELQQNWFEAYSKHEASCKEEWEVQGAAANGAYVRELGRINIKEKVLERKSYR